MASLKNAMKCEKRHRERHQPATRQSLGLLEKKKDYVIRAKNYNDKKRTLKGLRKKALEKNPDEFYHRMISSKLMEDGTHHDKPKEDQLTPDQISLMQTQDLRYIVHKRTIEQNKIERLRATLQLLDDGETKDIPNNKHTFFVDTEAEKKNFDICRRLDTHSEMLGRTYNRPRIDDLRNIDFSRDNITHSNIIERRDRSYRELHQRIARERNLAIVQAKMEVKRDLANKRKEKPVALVNSQTKKLAPVYRWAKERRR